MLYYNMIMTETLIEKLSQSLRPSDKQITNSAFDGFIDEVLSGNPVDVVFKPQTLGESQQMELDTLLSIVSPNVVIKHDTKSSELLESKDVTVEFDVYTIKSDFPEIKIMLIYDSEQDIPSYITLKYIKFQEE